MKTIDNLDDILSVEGLDVVCFGALDFSLSLGKWDVAGIRDHPEVKKAFDIVINKCKNHGIYVWFSPPANLEVIKELVDKGVTIFTPGNDLGAFISMCNGVMENIVKKVK